jgi:uncharacterized protein
MAKTQKYGIKYPFTSNNNDEIFVDLDKTYEDSIKSQVLHVLFTPKGQKLRDPDFGTSLIKYIFGPKDDTTFSLIKDEIVKQVEKYVPSVIFKDVTIYNDENDENSIIVMAEYSVKKGNNVETTTVAVKL